MRPIEKQIEDAFKFMKNAMSDGAETMAHAFIETPEGELTVMAFDGGFFANVEGKEQVATALLIKTLEAGSSVFVSDSWYANPTTEQRASLPPRLADWPAHLRSECLICVANQVGQKPIVSSWLYTRDAKGIPIWGELKRPGADDVSVENRFGFDLTHSGLRNMTGRWQAILDDIQNRGVR